MGEGKDNVSTLMGTRRLADAVRAAKIAAALRSDVAADARDADRARLEILAEELAEVIDEVPAGDDRFDLTLSGSQPPRFWVDVTAHVAMARDRRTYRFVRDTRLGRILLAESTETALIADRVTDYIAERIVEREKALADPDALPPESGAMPAAMPEAAVPAPAPAVAAEPASRFLWALCWLMIGIVLGAGLLYGLAAYRGFIPR